MQLLLDTITDCAIVCDTHGAIQSINTALRQALGYDTADSIDLKSLLSNEARDHLLRAVAAESSSPVPLNLTCLKKNGQPLFLKGQLLPPSKDGQVIGILLPAASQDESDYGLLHGLLHIQERERELLACRLHDGFVQDVVGARMWMESVEHECKDVSDVAKEALAVVRKSIDQAVVQARELIHVLRPTLADDAGIVESLEVLVEQFDRQTKTDIEFQCAPTLEAFSPLTKNAIIRICQEALGNIVHHSQATKASVALSAPDGFLRLEISDNGVGFELEDLGPEDFGVESITSRAAAFGGRASVTTRPGQGTRIVAELPAVTRGAPRPVDHGGPNAAERPEV